MIAGWVVLALAASHTLDSDGVAYVNIAIACMGGHWQAAVNRYWSPGYPVLFSFWLRIFKPSAYHEIAAVRWFDLLALVGALASFELFLRTLLKSLRRRNSAGGDGARLSPGSVQALGYALFFWATCYLTPPSVNPPDILVLIALLLAGGIGLRIVDGDDRWRNYLALGVVLGLGYVAKAAMFPLSFVFLASVALAVRNRRNLSRLLLSLLAFLLVSGPLLFALTKKQGHLSFGSSGAITYAMTVDHADPRGYWRGEPPGTGVPVHPIRKLMDAPAVYEYAMPHGGNLPLWLHHAYWYDGVLPRFNLRRQINVIHICLDAYFRMLVIPLGPLLAAFLLLILLERRFPAFFRRFFGAAILWMPAVAGFAMYALVHVEARFLSGFVLLLWAAFCLSIRLPEQPSGKGLDRGLTWTVVALLGLQIALAVGHSATRLISGNPFPAWQVATTLRQEGIEPGDKVCYLGNPVWDDAWALLARVQIVCNIPVAGVPTPWRPNPLALKMLQPSSAAYLPEFWAANPVLRSRILSVFRRAGAQGIVARDVPANAPDDWARVGKTGYYVLRLKN